LKKNKYKYIKYRKKTPKTVKKPKMSYVVLILDYRTKNISNLASFTKHEQCIDYRRLYIQTYLCERQGTEKTMDHFYRAGETGRQFGWFAQYSNELKDQVDVFHKYAEKGWLLNNAIVDKIFSIMIVKISHESMSEPFLEEIRSSKSMFQSTQEFINYRDKMAAVLDDIDRFDFAKLKKVEVSKQKNEMPNEAEDPASAENSSDESDLTED